MNKWALASVIGVIGATCGFASGWFISQKRCLAATDKEVESVKEKLEKEYKRELDEARKEIADLKNITGSFRESNDKGKKSPVQALSNDLQQKQKEDTEKKKYYNYAKQYTSQPSTRNDASDDDKPFVLSGEQEAFETGKEILGYTYYSDGVLTDENDNVVNDIDGRVGINNIKNMSDDLPYVYVCNPKTSGVYEICYDDRTYTEAVGKRSLEASEDEDEDRVYDIYDE